MPDLNNLGYERLETPIPSCDGVPMHARIYLIADEVRETMLLVQNISFEKFIAELLDPAYDEKVDASTKESIGHDHIAIVDSNNFQHLLDKVIKGARRLDAKEATDRLRRIE